MHPRSDFSTPSMVSSDVHVYGFAPQYKQLKMAKNSMPYI